MNNKNLSKVGFTLLEILIAVLIIGVLTTIALPMYQGAVDKSKWARLIAPARAVSTAQEAAFMNYGGYTANIDDLDVSLPEGNDMTYTLYTTTNGDDANFIRIVSTQLNDVRLAKYYKNNEGFEDQLYCEAKNGNDRANKLCGKLLKGEELVNTDDGYKMYLIDDVINKPLCNRVSLWWSNNFTHCYHTEEERCTANNMPYGTFCGWTNTNGQTISEGGTCKGLNNSCKNSIINEGGTCEGSGFYSCNGSTINNGGECIGDHRSCQGVTVNDGGICRAVVGDSNRSCQNSTINAGGECIADEASNEGCRDVKLYGGKCTAGVNSAWACVGAEVYDGGVCDGTNGRNNTESCYKAKVYDGGTCIGSCVLAAFYEGSVCEGTTQGACRNLGASYDSGFYEGSVCNGRVAGSCDGVFYSGSVCHGYAVGGCASSGLMYGRHIAFESGSRCVAHVAGSCIGTYKEGSCCEGGDNCPANAPRC